MSISMRGYLAFPNLLDHSISQDHRIPQRTCIIWSTFWEIQKKQERKDILSLQSCISCSHIQR